ncbi:MAG TPA: TonB-dependent receptor [Chitinophagaceae bacterium]|nr:TonB-dependent receptor [Chitinophagaceae bacterium]
MKFNIRLLFSLFFILTFTCQAWSQNSIRVTGKVTRKNTGEPLAGATVTVKGTSTSTITDETGVFGITTTPGSTLVVSYTGLTLMESVVPATGEVNFSMEEGATGTLTDVVIVGYGSQRRANVTGAISTIKTKELVQSPVADLSNALQGRVPGIITKQTSGEPGRDGANIYIRGNATFGATMEPLFVVDGIVRSFRDFSQLDANEVESVSFLKDASSAAIFGVRGANGVVLVTTKRGRAGKIATNYSFNYGLQEVTKMNNNLGSYEYATLLNEALYNDGLPLAYTNADIAKFQSGEDPTFFPNTNWQKLVLGGTAAMMQHNLSFSGGSEKVKYFASLGYLDQDGLYKSLNYKRYNVRLNLDLQVTNLTKVSIDLGGRLENRTAPTTSISSIFEHTLRNPPTIPAEYPGIGYAQVGSYVNTLRAIDPAAGYDNSENNTILTTLSIDQQIPWVKGLSVKGVFAYDKRMNYSKRWNDNVYVYTKNPTTGNYDRSTYNNPSLNESYFQQYQTELQAHINYSNRFGKHGVSALVLFLQQERPQNQFAAGRSGYEFSFFDVLSQGPATNAAGTITETISGTEDRFALRSAAARVNYDYDNKYMFQASLRADESENFAPDYRRGYFPAFSVGWIISNENFMGFLKPQLDYLKLKASWGQLGSDAINARFLYLSRYSTVANNYAFGGTTYPGLNPTASNPTVSWETSTKTDVGFEARLFRGKLDVEFDYFYEKRADILAVRSAQIPSTYGGPLPAENVGEVENKGIEITLGHNNRISNDLTYNIKANLTFARNKIIYAPEGANVPEAFKVTGRSIGSYFGYKATGIIKDSATYNAYGKTTAFPIGLGDIMYDDINKDGKIDNGDRQWLNTGAIPEIVYGISGGVIYKGFEVNFLFQGATNVYQQLTQNAGFAFFNGGRVTAEWLDRWTPDHPDAKYPRVSTNATATTNNYQIPGGPAYGVGGNSFWIEDASYLRLKNVEIAYTFKSSFLSKIGASQLRVYATGQNLVTFTELHNVDPENTNASGWYYPAQSVYNFGINIQF